MLVARIMLMESDCCYLISRIYNLQKYGISFVNLQDETFRDFFFF